MSLLRNQAEGIIPVEYSKEIIEGVVKGSSILSNSKMETMNANTKKLSNIQGVEAYQVDEASKITASDVTFPSVDLVGKKYAAIAVVSNEVLNESLVDVLEEIKKEAVEQFHRGFDRYAVGNILTAVTASGQSITQGATSGQALYEDISDTMALVEEHGLDPNTFLAHNSYKSVIRSLKDSNGNAMYLPKSVGTPDEFYGQPISYNFGVDRTQAELVTGDFRYSHVGLPGELRYTVMNQGTINGVNLGETDQVAVRLVLPMAHTVSRKDAFASLKPTV